MDTLSTAGWDAITHTLLAQYPSQTDPIHYAPPVSYRLGGSDPLDGISIYDGGEFYHFVTYGFSELYEKESENEQYSGFGFELTLKLRKSCIRKREKEQKNICGILQTLAHMSYENGDIFAPEDYAPAIAATSSGVSAVRTVSSLLILRAKPAKVLPGPISTPVIRPSFIPLETSVFQRTGEHMCFSR